MCIRDRKDTGIPLIADGGLRYSGDVVKALASIAAVAEVELQTRPASEELGTRLLIAG